MAKKTSGEQIKFGEKIIERSMDEVMHSSMMPYAEHVILERALPRVEDGLKPVQRRILYTMMELGLSPDKPYRKSARIVGDCLGKYHPHGDLSVYDAMVRMAQGFNMSMPLVDGHGNFGSIDGDSAAAMRYTEARMMPLALELLRDIDKDTVSFNLNFDDTLKEPDLLPGRFPNLLVNGASGIAVGLATNIPPHNLGEATDAVLAQLEDPDVTVEELMKLMPCPDFPTGGYILDSDEIKTAYETGRGKLTMRAKTHIEEQKNGRKLIVITEIPYQVNKARLLEEILHITQEKKTLFAAVSDIRDESDRLGMRAVVEVKKEGDAEKILGYLYKYSDLQATFGVNMVAIADGKPRQLGLKELISCYIGHQENVVTRRTEFELENAKRREHVLLGLMVAIDNLDEVIKIIRASKTPKIARDALMERFSLSEIQAQAILDLRLQRLTNLEMLSIEKEYKEILRQIKMLEGILGSKAKLREVIRKELTEIKEKYAVPRRTLPMRDETHIEIPEEPPRVAEETVVTILPDEKLRKVLRRNFNTEQALSEGATHIIYAPSDKRLKIFMNTGVCLTLCIDDIPESKPNTRPTSLTSLIPVENGERIIAVFTEENAGRLLFATRAGSVRLSEASEFKTRQKRIAAITIKDGDELISVEKDKGETLVMVTRNGMSIRFNTADIPCMGRSSAGVRGIKLDGGDSVVFAGQTEDAGEMLLISDRGYMKRSLIFDYDVQNRYGKGLKTFDFKKNGSNGTEIAAAFYVKEPIDMVITQRHGTVTTVNSESVLIEPRLSKGFPEILAVLDDTVISAKAKAPVIIEAKE